MSRIKSIKGLFGQMIHYKDGKYAGESWPGIFEGSYEHYDADGSYAGYSDPGLIADQVHHDVNGKYIGETHTGLFGQKKHYRSESGYFGETWEGYLGSNTDILHESEQNTDLLRDDAFESGFWSDD